MRNDALSPLYNPGEFLDFEVHVYPWPHYLSMQSSTSNMIETNPLAESILDSDADLLKLFCCHRDEAAFARLVHRHGPMVLGVCHQLLRHHQDAQDAFQATFLVLATRATSIRKEDSLASWLYKVAYRTSMRAAKNRHEAYFDSVPDDVPIVDDPLTTIHIQSLQLALHEELSRMPATYQGPVILCYLEGKTRQQAAEELNCSDASVKAKLTRAKRMLRARLTRRGIALSVAIASCSTGISTTAQAASPDFFATTVAGCLASLGSTSFTFSTSVTRLVTQGSTMTSIPTSAKYMAVACLSGIAFLGIAWATNISIAQDAIQPRVMQFHMENKKSLNKARATRVSQLGSDSTQLVSDTSDISFFMGVHRGNDPKTQRLNERISFAEKKAAAYLMLRDAELQRAEIAKDSPSKLEAKARAQLHEAEADELASEIKKLKSKMSAEIIRVDPTMHGAGTYDAPSLEPVPCCRDNNLAYGRSVTASSQEEIINNLAQLAVDGDLSTRWCADGEQAGEWIQLDLGAPRDVNKIRIHWEMMETKYSYRDRDLHRTEKSLDADLSIRRSDPQAEHMPEHELNAKETQFIRITFLGNDDGFWSSIREIEVTDGELSEPPVEAWEKVREDASGFEMIELMMLLDA